MMEKGDQREAGEPGDDGGVGLDPQAVDRPAAGPAEDPFVDNLLAVAAFRGGFYRSFPCYCIFLSCSLILTRRTETFPGVIPTIWPISS